jgi:hypothetical protein
MNRTRPYPHYKFPDEITIEAALLTDDSCSWYKVPHGSYELRCINYGWFPTEVVMTVNKGKYEDGYNIGASISGTMGTSSIAVTNIDKAIEMLKMAGYTSVTLRNN